LLDGGSPFYDVYETSDHKYISLGSIEPQFYAELLEKLGLGSDELFANQFDIPNWSTMKKQMEVLIKTKTRDQWDEIFAASDVCYAPVLSMEEVRSHPHHQARGTFLEDKAGVWQPHPAPRFSRSKAAEPSKAVRSGEHTDEVLETFGFSAAEIQTLKDEGAVV